MDNAYHALIMAGSVLLFIIGITSAVYNYNKLLEANEKILTNSEYYNRDAENFQYSDNYQSYDDLNTDDLERTYTGAEIANMIFNMYTVKQIDVGTGQAVPEKSGIERDEQGPYATPSTERQVVNSDIAYQSISVLGTTYDRNQKSQAAELDTIRRITTLKNGKQKRYRIVSSNFDGSNSTISFEEITD